MSALRTPSPLAGAALALIGDGVTPADLVARFRKHGATIAEDAARDRLEELCDLGLARPDSTPAGTRYRTTTLGERISGASLPADPDHADLLIEIEQMRTELLSTIAHELRTPLTAVRTSIGLLLDPSVEPSHDEHRTLLLTIDRNATRMQRVVGDILDLARFRSGRVQLQRRRFDARELAATAIASVAPLADAREQTLELEAPSVAVPVFGDYRRLEQALVNLLSNAEKYSPDGSPIRVTVSSTDTEVSWAVSDQGPGIEAEHQARLFERFFVAAGDDQDTSGGIGLGLPITLQIVQAHGGHIDVRSRPGEGSTFTVIVPRDGPEDGSDG